MTTATTPKFAALDSVRLDASIAPLVHAALDAGLRVYALARDTRARGFVYVANTHNGSFASICRHDFPLLGGLASLSALIKPSREYGSSVAVDYDGTLSDAVRKLREVCHRPNVTVRFCGSPAPVVPNRGYAAIESWPGGVDAFIELTLDGVNA